MNGTAKLGAFMIAALLVVGFFILRIEQLQLGGAEQQEISATFGSVAGLDAKSAVRIAGVRVGQVRRIELQDGRALVTLGLDPAVALREGARAQIRTLGMLGEQYIEVDPGPVGAPALKPGSRLSGYEPAGFDTVLDTANRIGGDVKEVTESLRRTLGGDEGQRRLDEIVENIRQLTEVVKLIALENRATVQTTLTNFRDFSETLKTEMPKLAEKLNSLADRLDTVVAENRENVSGSLANVRDLTARLRTSADNINEITAKINRGDGSIGKLVNDGQTVDNLNATLKSVQGGVDSLKNTIGRAERWQLDLDLRAEALTTISDSRTSFNAELATTPQRFYRIGAVRSPNTYPDERTRTVTTVVDGGPPSTTVQTVRETKNDFGINAQVGYRLYPNTDLRAGLFESFGGVGVDQYFFDRKAALSVEAYDFGRDVKAPRMRAEARYHLNKNLYAYAGIDDPRLKANRSFFVGGGVRWNDEDMKYLLGTLGSVAK